MSSPAPTSLTLAQKKKLWENQKYDRFEEISKDKGLLFNYFLTNNDIFNMISQEDEFKLQKINQSLINKQFNIFFGSAAAVLLIDQVLLRFFFTNIRFNFFRKFPFTGFVFKYLALPIAAYTVSNIFFMDEYEEFFFRMQNKYSFGFQDYVRANRIYERALAVDRLEELLQKRDQFDWTGIPLLPEQSELKTQLKNI